MVANRNIAGKFAVLAEGKRGGTARIFKAIDLDTHQLVAVKVYSSSGLDEAIATEIWHRECKSLEILSHQNIVRMLDAGRDPETGERYIALEWVDGETLESTLAQAGSMSWGTFLERFGDQILDALVFAAEKNVIHRDLSPGNVIVTPTGAVKIIDFGQAKLESVGIGLTVKDWRTVPYCLPEDDTGRFTQTRDPFAFCALAIRAMVGRPLNDHEELFAAAREVSVPADVGEILHRALSRIPEERFATIVDFACALRAGTQADESSPRLRIPIRFSPDALAAIGDAATDGDEPLAAAVLAELNDLVAIAPAGAPTNPKIDLETQSFRLTGYPARERDHLVVDKVVRRFFRLDQIYRSDHWVIQADFSTVLPVRQGDRERAVAEISQLYRGLENHLTELAASKRRGGPGVFDEWGRVLDALRYLAKNSVPALRYRELQREGSRLIATVENPEDAAEDQLRVIASGGKWLFRGEVESVAGGKCVINSTRGVPDLDALPTRGTLEIDWLQTKVALDRQARALDRFRAAETPSAPLRAMLIGDEKGADEPSFAKIGSFFDPSLDPAKKAIVSRFRAGAPLMVVHGPPGSGKTKLIVEVIRQELAANPDAKILLASQTHIALDNALEGLLRADGGVSCVRIGSGSKEADPRVAATSLAERSRHLRDQVSTASRAYIEERAVQLGVDKREVELGLGVLDLRGAKQSLERVQVAQQEVMTQAEAVRQELSENSGETRARDAAIARARALEESLDELRGQELISRAEVDAARRALVNLGQDGKDLSVLSASELAEWADMLLADGKRRAIGDLMRLAEEWKARFDQSDDFKVAIISSSSVIAGTCVGFCREEASFRSVFDLCIVDEAGKATTGELLVPLAQSRRALLLGDHHQLPPVLDHDIRSRDVVDNFALNNRQLEVQLFEQLTTHLADSAKASLTEQHRMRGAIGRLVSQCFYEGALTEGDSVAKRKAPDLGVATLETEVVWLNPYAGRWADAKERPRGTSFENAREAQAVVTLLKRIAFALEAMKGAWRPSIGVIAGYGPQVALLRSEIRKERALDGLDVECASVHSFQGREVDICIYSVTRKNGEGKIGMLSDWRHLNVALSRAKSYLVVVGDLEFCKAVAGANPFADVVKFVARDPGCTVKEWADA